MEKQQIDFTDVLTPTEPRKKPVTFHHTGCFKGILTMDY